MTGQYAPDELLAAVLATANGQPRLSPDVVGILVNRLRVPQLAAADRRAGDGDRLPVRRMALVRAAQQAAGHQARRQSSLVDARSAPAVGAARTAIQLNFHPLRWKGTGGLPLPLGRGAGRCPA